MNEDEDQRRSRRYHAIQLWFGVGVGVAVFFILVVLGWVIFHFVHKFW